MTTFKFIASLMLLISIILVLFSVISTYAEEVPFRYVSIASSNTRFNFTDDSFRAFSSPFFFFPFNQQETPVTNGTILYVSSNGFVTFVNAGQTAFAPQIPLPQTAVPNDLLAGFWSDLNPSAGGSIFVAQRSAINGPFREVVVQYDDVPYFLNTTRRVSFQIAFFENTSCAEYRYLSIDAPPGPYNIGFENINGTEAFQWRTANFPLQRRSIRLCTGIDRLNFIQDETTASEDENVNLQPLDIASNDGDEVSANSPRLKRAYYAATVGV